MKMHNQEKQNTKGTLVNTVYEICRNKHFLPWEHYHCVAQMKAVPLLSFFIQEVQRQGGNKYKPIQANSLTKVRRTFFSGLDQTMPIWNLYYQGLVQLKSYLD